MQTSRPEESEKKSDAWARRARLVGRGTKYALLPGILPRLQGLSFAVSRFLFVFVQIFAAVGLIDRAHPCAQPENVGRYRFIDILGLAYYGLLQDRKNPQKLVMFVAVVAALCLSVGMLVATLALLLLSVPSAYAQYFGDAASGAGYVASEDLAYLFLGEVFGNTGVSFWAGRGLEDKHILFSPILRVMLTTYSQGLMLLAVLIVISLIIFMIIESARTGVPFGRSFNTVWAPFRIALGIAMLVPFGQGYNAAQLMVMQVSNWSSALATNVWIGGLSAYGDLVDGTGDPDSPLAPDNPNHPAAKLIRASQPKPGYHFMRGLFLTHLCRDLMNLNVFHSCTGTFKMDLLSDKEGVYDYYQLGTVTTGIIPVTLNADYCGSYKVPDPEELQPSPVYIGPNATPVEVGKLGELIAQQYAEYYKKALELITQATGHIATELHTSQEMQIGRMTNADVTRLHMRLLKLYKFRMGYRNGIYFNTSVADPYLPADDPDREIIGATEASPGYLEAARADGNAVMSLLQSGKKYGWAGAGSIMLMLASANSIISSAVNSPPTFIAAPRLLANPVASPFFRNESISDLGIFSTIFQYLGLAQANVEILNKISADLSKGDTWFASRVYDISPDQPDPPTDPRATIAREMGVNLSLWNIETKDRAASSMATTDAMEMGGVHGFFLSFFKMEDEKVNPLTHIVAVGSGLFTLATSIVAAGALTAIFAGAGFFKVFLIAAAPLIIGAYMLAVVLPLALFLNFFFAVVEWVISVFEAVVGAPLWALSMVSISGTGLGGIAMNGIKILFEIMLRPTVIIITTVGSLILFSASVVFFNKTYTIFMLNYFNVTSGDGSMGEAIMMSVKNVLVVFGSLFLYVLTVYSIGNSCFKAIPTIANKFAGRWFGTPKAFSDVFKTDLDSISGMDQVKTYANLLGKKD